MTTLRGRLVGHGSCTGSDGGFLLSLTLRDDHGATHECLASDRVAHVAASLLHPGVELLIRCERARGGELLAVAVAAI